MKFVYALSGMLPALFLMWYVDRLDARRPEPRGMLRKAAIWGGLSTIPCIFAQWGLDQVVHLDPRTPAGALFVSFGSAALTEELAKAAVLYFLIWRHPAFDERMDGIVYATRAGLGFALVENIGYLMKAESVAGFAGIFVLRAVLAVPGHAIYAGFMGYYAARKKFDNVGPGLLGGLLIAILLHGTYDAAIFMCGALPKGYQLFVLVLLPIPFLVVGLGLWRLKVHARRALALDEQAHPGRPHLPPGMGFVLH